MDSRSTLKRLSSIEVNAACGLAGISSLTIRNHPPVPLPVATVFLLGTMAMATCAHSVVSDTNAGEPQAQVWDHLASSLMSRAMWSEIARDLGADRAAIARGEFAAPFLPILQVVGGFALLSLFAASGIASISKGGSFFLAARRFAFRGWRWWLIAGGWEVARVVCTLLGWTGPVSFLHATLPLWLAVALGGWLSESFRNGEPSREADLELAAESTGRSARISFAAVAFLCAIYVAAFVWMNWQLYFGLHVPHGDSAMYEEHLWNLTHGKGFRSYLDDGRLFLGEHVQVVHVLLLPVYWFWPSHLLLELFESLALASGAISVFWMARRHGGSTRAAILLAGAYLLFTPLHFLDIAVDLKTFRPTSFGVPAMLFAIDQLERKRYRTMALLFLVALSAKEDYAVIMACIGLWLAVFGGSADETSSERKRRILWGLGLAIFGAGYLLAVIKLIIPAFRGDVPHYARYFGELGDTPGDVAASFFTQPGVVFGKLFSQRSLIYALVLLLPLGFLPLRSTTRLAVGLPWFGVLCLLELTSDPTQQGMQMLVPGHHFHAPLIPVLFWSAAAGLGARGVRLPWWSRREVERVPSPAPPSATAMHRAGFAFSLALVSGAILSFHPLSAGFWDHGSQLYWKNRFIPGERAEKFAVVEELIPQDARVFSTDFVHTRLTHRKRSYDYSAYKRKSDEELTKPVTGETYYIVIDLKSRYNLDKPPEERVREAADIPAYVANPDAWEVVDHPAKEDFLVLRRLR